jgi:hypothetical protein
MQGFENKLKWFVMHKWHTWKDYKTHVEANAILSK